MFSLEKSVRNSIKMWNILDKKVKRFKIDVPPLKMTKIQLRKLTYDDAREIKAKVNITINNVETNII